MTLDDEEIPIPKKPFSQILQDLLNHYSYTKNVSFYQIHGYLADKSDAALIIVLATPLITPVPLPGISMTLGLIIATLSIPLVRKQPAILPKFVGNKTIEYNKLCKAVNASQKVLFKFEKFLRHRNSFFVTGSPRKLAALSFISSGVAIALPLPPVVLFSNSIPAIAILFLAFGFLEDDGTFVLIGHLISLFTWFYFAAWGEVIRRSFEYIFTKYF